MVGIKPHVRSWLLRNASRNVLRNHFVDYSKVKFLQSFVGKLTDEMKEKEEILNNVA